ncbi:MAG: type VI secretion system tip protein VgrG [Candidatus Competibacter sp.]|nr:type VI secretion system tip protein VgrG [Candidatus Competibacter sp.]MDG4606899.1 type VI secretion system tip protein TssI/VgrG [Candidatus Contendobacter sp.]HRD48340.1 type VI secretion system tip protein TssI/VgrG [Candidatus Contendobacter sp.]
MPTITQKHRIFAVGTSLGEDVLVFGRMTATEQLGRLFEFDLELLSERTDIALSEVLGKNMTVRMELPEARGGGTRYFNGFVTRFSYLGMRGLRYGLYRATLSPWLWFLTRTSDCRIFQNMTVPAIIEQVFHDHGFNDFIPTKLSGSYRTWEYCVQYRETDFNFVSRLMQQEGIYYYFTHENGKHTLVLADNPGSHSTFSGYDQVPYYPPDVQEFRERDHIYEWTVEKQVQSGAYALNDFDFMAPRKNLRTLASTPKDHAMADLPMYDYPGDYTEASDGNAYSAVRLQELLAQHEILRGQGIARGLAVGYLFSLTHYGREDQNRKYLIVSAVHDLQSDTYESVAGIDAAKPYVGRITAIDAQQQYRAPRINPKPVVQGPQTAIVVGASGDEIHTDQYGRVKCQFHWDRYGEANQNSSCWIRVAQSWAGKKWGTLYLPRVGHEVIVDFLEGDPHRPIITGRVYNDINKPPYTLPDNKTMSTLKSLSSTGGDGFNEFRFEDKKGSEQIFLHAERNQDIRVKNNALEWIGNERHLIVKKKQFEQVEGEKHLIVKSGDGGSGDQFEKVEGDKHQKVVGDHNQKIEGVLSIDVVGDIQEKTGGNYAMDASSAIHIKAGQTVVIEAGSQLTIKVGGNFVTIGSAGVSIKGTTVAIKADGIVSIDGSMVNINCGGSGASAGSGAGSSPGAPTAPTAPQEAANAEPGELSDAAATPIQKQASSLDSVSVGAYESPQAQALTSAAQSGAPFCEKCEEARRAEEAQRAAGGGS